jgi:nucleoside 2-deoxyribosyltransferase
VSAPRLYLAGPITGLNYHGAADWRQEVKTALWPSIVAFSPMRGKEYLKALPVIGDARVQQNPAEDSYGLKNVMSSAQGITGRDRNDVMNADAVLMNLLGATRVSIGTMIEAGWADAFRKPVIVVREKDSIHGHGMLDAIATYTVADLDEALHLTRMLLLPH